MKRFRKRTLGKIALYPGTFDPITNGHLDLIRRGKKLFEELVVGVAHNPAKEALFTKEERIEMIKALLRGKKEIRIVCLKGLVVDFAKREGIQVILRGLRTISDFEYEFQMALTNRALAPGIETVFIMPSELYSYTSSRFIKETIMMGGDVSRFVPSLVEKRLKKKIEELESTGKKLPL